MKIEIIKDFWNIEPSKNLFIYLQEKGQNKELPVFQKLEGIVYNILLNWAL